MRVRSLLVVMGVVGVLTAAASAPATAQNPGRYRSVATGMCLDSDFSGHVYTLACNGGDYQNWELVADPRGGLELRNVATGRCLDSDFSGEVYTLACNSGDYQDWMVRDFNGGATRELTNLATGRCLDSDITGHVYTHVCNGGDYQRWWN